MTCRDSSQRRATNGRLRRIVAAFLMAMTAAVALPLATAAPAAAATQCQGSGAYAWFSSCTYALPGETKTDDWVISHGQVVARFEVFTHRVSDGTTLIRVRQTGYSYSAHHNASTVTSTTWRYAWTVEGSHKTYVYKADGSFDFVEDTGTYTETTVEFDWAPDRRSFTRIETTTVKTPGETNGTTTYYAYEYRNGMYVLVNQWAYGFASGPLFFRWR